MKNNKKKDVILFDGICNLCNGFVLFIIDRDPKFNYMFSSLQSDYGKEMIKNYALNEKSLNTVVFIQNGKVFTKSSAVLKIAKSLKFPWFLISIFLIFPKFLRDWVYDFVAKNRYKWFGKQKECRMPTSEIKSRFIE